MDLLSILKSLAALAVVLGILLGGAYLLRKYGSRIGLKAGVVSTDLKVTEWRTLDMRRKLAVVRWGEQTSAALITELAGESQPIRAEIDPRRLREHVTEMSSDTGIFGNLHAEVTLPSPLLAEGLVFMDTPGVGRAQARVDDGVEYIHDQIDGDVDQRHHQQVGRHDRNVDVLHGLHEQQSHPRPLEHGFGDDRKSNNRAKLQPGDGDNGNQSVLQCVPEMDGAG